MCRNPLTRDSITSCGSREARNIDTSLLIGLSLGPEAMAEPDTFFSHSPLDLACSRTMRLIEVLPPRDGDSHVQCRLTHATHDAQYACLSYVWGTDDPDHMIYINGLRLQVRRNLWSFLQYLSTKASRSTSVVAEDAYDLDRPSLTTPLLWIDALCIDQENTLERNHQVQQMGQIYEHAQHVVVWLGNKPDTASFLKEYTKQQTAKIRLNQLVGIGVFCKDMYWQRAWITQEVLLARNLSFVAEEDEVDLTLLVPALKDYLGGFVRSYGYRQYQVFYDILERGKKYTLVENIWRFRQKKCLHRRDLIYSLFSISQVDACFEVDYDLPIIDLAHGVLRSLGSELCFCNVKIVLQVLDCLSIVSGFTERPFATVDLPPPSLGSAIPQCPRCGEPIEFGEIWALFPSAMIQFFCLGCSHHETRLHCPKHQDAFRHGHLILVRYLEHESICTWQTYWLRPNQGRISSKRQELHGPLSGVRVLEMETGVPSKLLISSRVFAKWASEEFEAEIKPQREFKPSDVLTKEVILRSQINPKWKLLGDSDEWTDAHTTCTDHLDHDRLHYIVAKHSR